MGKEGACRPKWVLAEGMTRGLKVNNGLVEDKGPEQGLSKGNRAQGVPQSRAPPVSKGNLIPLRPAGKGHRSMDSDL